MSMQRTVLITGTSSGIGKTSAELFAEEGWTVYAGMRDPQKVTFMHENIVPVKLDVNDRQSIAALFAKFHDENVHLDCVVNNAGWGLVLPFEDIPSSEIEGMFRTNVFGLMEICKYACRMMRKAQSGTVINISSMAGRVGYPWYAVYTSTKWAVEGFSETLWYEMKPFGVCVKLIEPGRVKTSFHAYAYSEEAGKHVSDQYAQAYAAKKRGVSESFETPGRFVLPEKVAQLIFRAATDGSDRLRYPIGRDAKKAIFWKRFLPERLFLRKVLQTYVERKR